MLWSSATCPTTGRRVYKFLGMDLLFPLMLFCLAMENSPLLCAVLGVAFWVFILLHFRRRRADAWAAGASPASHFGDDSHHPVSVDGKDEMSTHGNALAVIHTRHSSESLENAEDELHQMMAAF